MKFKAKVSRKTETFLRIEPIDNVLVDVDTAIRPVAFTLKNVRFIKFKFLPIAGAKYSTFRLTVNNADRLQIKHEEVDAYSKEAETDLERLPIIYKFIDRIGVTSTSTEFIFKILATEDMIPHFVTIKLF